MEFLAPFVDFTASDQITISAEQGSQFAKQVAGDFNPIHDPASKRYCVPGDLLFAVALKHYGLHQRMTFSFLDMVSGGSTLTYPALVHGAVTAHYADTPSKPVLGVETEGDSVYDEATLENVIRQYVAFSGHNFPHILLPLMQQHDVMINPARPLVIYESMSFSLNTLMFEQMDIRLANTELAVQGKRGKATLKFSFFEGDRQIGEGAKQLVLSGLRPYEDEAMSALCESYLADATLATPQ